MPGFLLHANVGMQCFHAAPAATAPTNTVLVSGQSVATLSNLITVAGCPFQVPVGAGTKPQPCATIKWSMIATRVFVNGQAALLQAGPGVGAGVCQSAEQIPQGAPQISAMQSRVSGI